MTEFEDKIVTNRQTKINSMLAMILTLCICNNSLARLGANPAQASITHPLPLTAMQIDLSAQLGPIRDQGDSPWCGAFVASDLITSFAKAREPISALDVAWSAFYSDEMASVTVGSKLFHEGADISALDDYRQDYDARFFRTPPQRRGAIDVAEALVIYNARAGSCSESQLPSEVSQLRLNHDDYLITKVTPAAPADGSLRTLINNSASVGRIGYVSSAFLQPLSDEMLQAQKSANEEEARAISQKLDSSCKVRRSIPTLKPQSLSVDLDSLLQAEIQISRSLRTRRIVSLELDACALLPQSPKSILWTRYRNSCAHVVSVVGLNWDPKSRQQIYKIRNSWGPTCNFYNDYFKNRCVDGYLYVSSQDLRHLDISYLTWLSE